MRGAGGSITDVPGIRVGHATDLSARTGCTVVLPEDRAVAGVDVRGSAPGTREVELLHPVRLVHAVDAILLTGGSAFGLDAAGGVQHFLEERGRGFDTGLVKVPIVPTAVIFDLALDGQQVRPDKEMGYRACLAAGREVCTQGRVGAGAGATVGKVLGPTRAMYGGVGTCAARLGHVTVGALVVVNALGNIIEPHTGRTVAGATDPTSGKFVDPLALLATHPPATLAIPTNTTLAVVATDALCDRDQATKVAQMAQDGIARAVYPAHTMYDGDIVFVLSVGGARTDISALGAMAAELVAQAIVNAVLAANGTPDGAA